MKTVWKTDLSGLHLISRGKVRDLYAVPERDDCMLMVATDRLSAFDVVMDDPIPGKGQILTALSLFWFDFFKDTVVNHLETADVDRFPASCAPHREILRGRSMLVKKYNPLPVECIVRGYLSGSCWQEYRQGGVACGYRLPREMREAQQLPTPLFTPSTKAELGEHDENISVARMEEMLGREMTERIRQLSLTLYSKAAAYARGKGIIIADTKFEMGTDNDGRLVLIDEVLTPDSSRFWPMDEYEAGHGQKSYDKQFVRDYLLSLDWPKRPPPPALPPDIVQKTADRYQEALRLLTR